MNFQPSSAGLNALGQGAFLRHEDCAICLLGNRLRPLHQCGKRADMCEIPPNKSTPHA